MLHYTPIRETFIGRVKERKLLSSVKKKKKGTWRARILREVT